MRQLIKKIETTLGDVYNDTEELNAIIRAICCDILNISTTTYYLKEEVTLTEDQQRVLNDTTSRLKQGEPLQYIEGKAPFCGMDFIVTPATLIPRPETTELVDWIVQEHALQRPRILDLGTGSGCIAIAISKRLPDATVDACDISDDALIVAMKNGEKNKAKVSFFHHDILDLTTPPPHSYDILVSNPPYIKQSEEKEMETHVTQWEPHTALFVPDDDALRFYRAIAEIGLTDALLPGGHIYVEINQAFGKETVELFESYGYHGVTLRKDIYGNDRMVKGVKSEKLEL
jgi:release factor glutamine methyltransferase